jgi:hypothetical protein
MVRSFERGENETGRALLARDKNTPDNRQELGGRRRLLGSACPRTLEHRHRFTIPPDREPDRSAQQFGFRSEPQLNGRHRHPRGVCHRANRRRGIPPALKLGARHRKNPFARFTRLLLSPLRPVAAL